MKGRIELGSFQKLWISYSTVMISFFTFPVLYTPSPIFANQSYEWHTASVQDSRSPLHVQVTGSISWTAANYHLYQRPALLEFDHFNSIEMQGKVQRKVEVGLTFIFSYSTISFSYYVMISFIPRSFVSALQVEKQPNTNTSYAMSSSGNEDNLGSMAVNYKGEWVGRASNNNIDVAQRPALINYKSDNMMLIMLQNYNQRNR